MDYCAFLLFVLSSYLVLGFSPNIPPVGFALLGFAFRIQFGDVVAAFESRGVINYYY